MNRPAMSYEEFDCRIEIWLAAQEYFNWSMLEAAEKLSEIVWGEKYDPVRGW